FSMSASTYVAIFGIVRDVSLAGTVGALLLVAAVLPKASPSANRAATSARVCTALWAASALGYSLASYAEIRDAAVDANRFLEEWWTYSLSVELLQAYLWVIAAAFATSIMAAFVRGPLLAGWSLVPVAWAVGW